MSRPAAAGLCRLNQASGNSRLTKKWATVSIKCFASKCSSAGHLPPLKTFSEVSNTSAKKIRLPLNALPRPSRKVLVRRSLFHTRVERAVWKGPVNFPCHRFPLWWFTESSKILWKSQTWYTAHRNGRQKNEVESREAIAPRVGYAIA